MNVFQRRVIVAIGFLAAFLAAALLSYFLLEPKQLDKAIQYGLIGAVISMVTLTVSRKSKR